MRVLAPRRENPTPPNKRDPSKPRIFPSYCRRRLGIIHQCLHEKSLHTRTRGSHTAKPTPGAICIVNLRGREPSRMRKEWQHRLRRRTRNASTLTFGRSSAHSNRRDAGRGASYTFTASSASGLLRPQAAGRSGDEGRERERSGEGDLSSQDSALGSTPAKRRSVYETMALAA